MDGRHDTGSIVDDVRALREDVGQVLVLLRGSEFTPGLVFQVKELATQVRELTEREQSRETRRAERSRNGVAALTLAPILAVLYHVGLSQDIAHSVGLHGWWEVLFGAVGYVVCTVLLVLGVVAVTR